MTATPAPLRYSALAFLFLVCLTPAASAGPKPENYWQVDDVKAGMKGFGRTVMKGTKLEKFDAEVLGVLKNTNPGRDLILCRLSGLNLEKTGVIAGMSGSPVYIDNKLVGAVAYAWAFGKEPIAGVTPFAQMHGFVESFERRDLAEQAQPRRVGLHTPIRIGDTEYKSVTISEGFEEATPTAADGLWMMPLRTPLAATGFTPHSLSLLRKKFPGSGMVPMQGGAAAAKVADEEKNTPLEAGGPLAVSLIRGDMDLSGIGTVTHIEGDRVYGWGHPFFGLGRCQFPLMTGYIHTVYPRQTVSFKMGSPLREVGVINADVSTCIAGWTGRKAEMMPVRMKVNRDGDSRVFNVEMVRQRSLIAPLVFTALTNAVDMEGELPDELTARLEVRIEVEGREPIVIKDTFSGPSYSGGRAPQALYSQVSAVVGMLTFNSYKPVHIQRIDCETTLLPGRSTADIESIELDSDILSPGETLQATVFLQPYRGARQKIPVTLKLPPDLPEGSYSVTVSDDIAAARATLRDNPNLLNPQSLDQLFEGLKVQTSVKRTNLVVRVPVSAAGVAIGGKALPNLPSSMVQIMAGGKRTGAQTMGGAVISRQNTNWVVQGSESVRFTVTKNKKVLSQP